MSMIYGTITVLFVLLAVGILFLTLYLRGRAKARGERPRQHSRAAREAEPAGSSSSTRGREVLSAACPECGAKVDPTAVKCFYCGFDFASLSADSDEPGTGQS
jgi:hypothetical protein